MAEKKNIEKEKSKEELLTAERTVTKDLEADSQKGQFVRKQIGKQTVLVRVHFREEGAESLQDKICRMLGDEVRSKRYARAGDL